VTVKALEGTAHENSRERNVRGDGQNYIPDSPLQAEIAEFLDELPAGEVTNFSRFDASPAEQREDTAKKMMQLVMELGVFVHDMSTEPALSKANRARARELWERFQASGVE